MFFRDVWAGNRREPAAWLVGCSYPRGTNMKRPYLTATCLAGALLMGTLPVHPENGRVVFAGSIVEPACPLRDGLLDCPPGRPSTAIVRALDMRSAQRQIHAELFAYALQRDRTAAWRVVDVTYP